MAAESYGLAFNGFWRASNIAGLPAASGIYAVYACVNNAAQGTVSLRRLLYVGEAGNVYERVACHERWTDWQAHLFPGEELCFNAALSVPATDRVRAEAALINHHKPPCNNDCVYAFPYEETSIFTSGTNALMEPYFTVYPTRSTSLAALLGVLARK